MLIIEMGVAPWTRHNLLPGLEIWENPRETLEFRLCFVPCFLFSKNKWPHGPAGRAARPALRRTPFLHLAGQTLRVLRSLIEKRKNNKTSSDWGFLSCLLKGMPEFCCITGCSPWVPDFLCPGALATVLMRTCVCWFSFPSRSQNGAGSVRSPNRLNDQTGEKVETPAPIFHCWAGGVLGPSD